LIGETEKDKEQKKKGGKKVNDLKNHVRRVIRIEERGRERGRARVCQEKKLTNKKQSGGGRKGKGSEEGRGY
jgi:hypothetical protein